MPDPVHPASRRDQDDLLHRDPGAETHVDHPGQTPTSPPEPGADVHGERRLIRTTFQVDGMTCGHCVRAVEEALQQDGVLVEGVTQGSASVQYDPTKTSRDSLVAAIEEEGYKVTG
jgi:copper chaperone